MVCGLRFCGNPYFNIHTGEIINMLHREMQLVSRKLKLNTRISKEAELVSVDYVPVCIFWTVLFIEWKG